METDLDCVNKLPDITIIITNRVICKPHPFDHIAFLFPYFSSLYKLSFWKYYKCMKNVSNINTCNLLKKEIKSMHQLFGDNLMILTHNQPTVDEESEFLMKDASRTSQSAFWPGLPLENTNVISLKWTIRNVKRIYCGI